MKQIFHTLSVLLLFVVFSCCPDDDNTNNPLTPQLVELGELNIPYKNSFDYTFRENEPDNKITYTFSVDLQSNYIIKTDQNVELILKDNQGNTLASGINFVTSNPISSEVTPGEPMSSGMMSLELINRNSNLFTGNLLISIRDARDTDINLGVLSSTLDESYDFSIEDCEPDNRLGINFEITSNASYTISTSANVSIGLYNEQGELVASNSDSAEITGESLAPGKYEIDLINLQEYSTNNGVLRIQLNP